MGTDIHTSFQKQVDRTWVDVISNYEEGRQYALFAWLGNVRNGHGFAGVPTHNVITPLQSNRGLPHDFEINDEGCHPIPSFDFFGWRKEYRDENDPLQIWMGDHSFGWLSLDEILTAQPPTIMRTEVISLEAFKELKPNQAPDCWSGDIWGDGIVISSPDKITEETTHVRITWLSPLIVEFADFINECQRLKTEHGNVRMVFGFDS